MVSDKLQDGHGSQIFVRYPIMPNAGLIQQVKENSPWTREFNKVEEHWISYPALPNLSNSD